MFLNQNRVPIFPVFGQWLVLAEIGVEAKNVDGKEMSCSSVFLLQDLNTKELEADGDVR